MKAQQLIRVDRTLLDEAHEAFRPRPVTPDTKIEQIMFDAGAAKLLGWLETRISQKSNTTVQAVEDETILADSAEGLLRRLAKGIQ